jgi:hypothetical protein
MSIRQTRRLSISFLIFVTLTTLLSASAVSQSTSVASPKFSTAVAFDISPPLRSLPMMPRTKAFSSEPERDREIRPEGGPIAKDKGYSGDAALQRFDAAGKASTIPSPLRTFEGLSNQDNFNLFGGRVNPPDPVGDVGPKNYVEMVNLAFAVYNKKGKMLAGPTFIGDLWAGFAIPDCDDFSGDPIVLYDQFTDRWILSQFTTSGLLDPTLPFYNCVAISQTGDPAGAYFRYAFITSAPGSTTFFFPDYPKYSVWSNSYVLTSRDFGPTTEYGISVYALEKSKMIAGDPNARSVHFFLDSAVVPINLIGDGLLPADIDGRIPPRSNAAIPIFGTQDDGGPYGATSDALNIWDLSVQWKSNPIASLTFRGSFPVAPFDSIFPCAPTARDCLPQPGITDPNQFLDILSYRQRPTYRLAYRNFLVFEDLVTAQSVEALPGIAGMRWYEVVRLGSNYFVLQQGTYAPPDGINRWMGSVAMDKIGDMALGYSVVDGISVSPGIRYTARRRFDPLNQMTLGEGTIIDGTGVQTTTNSRWGDYTSMNIDPTDDCTFWYVNEYYQVSGVPLPLPPPPLPPPGTTAPWQTRIGSFKLPGCH